MARETGINVRHSRRCSISSGGSRCSCSPTYVAEVYVRDAGKRVRKSFPNLQAARGWRRDAARAARENRLRPAGTETVGDAAARFLADAEAGVARDRKGLPYKPSTLRGYRAVLERDVLPRIGARRLGDVRAVDLNAMRDDWLRAGASPATIRNRLVPLRVVFRRALRDDVVVSSPFTTFEAPASIPPPERRLVAPREAPAVLAALPPDLRPIWATAIYAGLRRGELQALTWRDVDLAGLRLSVRSSWDAKAGRVAPKSRAGTRTVPIVARLVDELGAWRAVQASRGDEWIAPDAVVFPGRGPSGPFTPSAAMRRARRSWEKIGIAPLRLHDGRHSAASAMIALGASVKDVQSVLGHADASTTTDIYAHLFDDALDNLRSRMDAQHAALDAEADWTG